MDSDNDVCPIDGTADHNGLGPVPSFSPARLAIGAMSVPVVAPPLDDDAETTDKPSVDQFTDRPTQRHRDPTPPQDAAGQQSESTGKVATAQAAADLAPIPSFSGVSLTKVGAISAPVVAPPVECPGDFNADAHSWDSQCCPPPEECPPAGALATLPCCGGADLAPIPSFSDARPTRVGATSAPVVAPFVAPALPQGSGHELSHVAARDSVHSGGGPPAPPRVDQCNNGGPCAVYPPPAPRRFVQPPYPPPPAAVTTAPGPEATPGEPSADDDSSEASAAEDGDGARDVDNENAVAVEGDDVNEDRRWLDPLPAVCCVALFVATALLFAPLCSPYRKAADVRRIVCDATSCAHWPQPDFYSYIIGGDNAASSLFVDGWATDHGTGPEALRNTWATVMFWVAAIAPCLSLILAVASLPLALRCVHPRVARLLSTASVVLLFLVALLFGVALGASAQASPSRDPSPMTQTTAATFTLLPAAHCVFAAAAVLFVAAVTALVLFVCGIGAVRPLEFVPDPPKADGSRRIRPTAVITIVLAFLSLFALIIVTRTRYARQVWALSAVSEQAVFGYYTRPPWLDQWGAVNEKLPAGTSVKVMNAPVTTPLLRYPGTLLFAASVVDLLGASAAICAWLGYNATAPTAVQRAFFFVFWSAGPIPLTALTLLFMLWAGDRIDGFKPAELGATSLVVRDSLPPALLGASCAAQVLGTVLAAVLAVRHPTYDLNVATFFARVDNPDHPGPQEEMAAVVPAAADHPVRPGEQPPRAAHEGVVEEDPAAGTLI